MKIAILMIGPGRDVKGGIPSVVNIYFKSDLLKDYNIIYISSHIDGNKFVKLIQFIKALFLFCRYMPVKDIKIVHIHSASRASFYRKSIFLILSKLCRKNVIFHIHGAEFNIFYHNESGLIKRKFIKSILCSADIIIALSNQWKNDIEKIVDKKNVVRVVNNAVMLPEVEQGVKGEKLEILFMGRLEERKGVFDLIKAAEKIVQDSPNVHFIFAGDGDINKVKKIIQEKKLSKYISVPGWVSNGEEYYAKVDIYVLPSYNEGLPMAILEAASHGLPIVSTPVGGIPEVIEDGVNGFLITPGDIGALEDRLLKLIDDGSLRKRMGNEARRIVEEKFDINLVSKEIDRLYQELLCN